MKTILQLQKDLITNWQDATQALATRFKDKYFGKDAEMWWVADNIGGTLEISDHYFSLDDMLISLKQNVTITNMFGYYSFDLDNAMKGKTRINYKTWLQLIKSKLK